MGSSACAKLSGHPAIVEREGANHATAVGHAGSIIPNRPKLHDSHAAHGPAIAMIDCDRNVGGARSVAPQGESLLDDLTE
jgi:hypothetical protein